MLWWSTILFVLGLLAFLDSIFNYGEIFRQVNSFFFMLISLGILIRLRYILRQKPDWESDKKKTGERIKEKVEVES